MSAAEPPIPAATPAPQGAAAAPARVWRWLPSLPLWLGLAALARALAEPGALLNDPDTYLHIAAGRWMLAHGALPTADPFSHTLAGAPWRVPEWLAEIVLAAVYEAAGWGGVAVAAALCFAAATAILARFLLRRLDALPTAIVVIASAALLLPHLLARPHILALPILALWCGLLLRARDDAAPPPWPALALVPLWANLHASVLFGLGLAGFAAGEAVLRPSANATRAAEARRWTAFVGVAVLAALLTPNGVEGLIEPFRLMAMPALRASFIEWQPADLRQFLALELWLLGLVALAFAVRARLPLTRLALLLALVHMALRHVRHADLLAIAAPLAIAAALAPALAVLVSAGSGMQRRLASVARPAAPAGIAAALLLAAALAAPVIAQPPIRSDDPNAPAAAVAAAARLGLAGPVFNSQAFGGYLAFVGVPPFIDGRIEMYGDAFLARYVAAERGDPAVLAALLDRYRIEWTLLAPRSPAAAAVERLPGWRQVYADPRAVIHARRAAPP